jgi:putative permease
MISIVKRWANLYFAEEESVVFALLLAFVAALLWLFGDVLVPVLAAIIIAYMLQGLVNLFCGKGVPHILAVALTVTLFIGASLALILVLFPLVWSQLSAFVVEIPSFLSTFHDEIMDLSKKYPQTFSEQQVQEWLSIASGEMGQLGQVVVQFSVASIPNIITILIYCVVVPLMVFFFLKDKDYFIDSIGMLLPRKRRMLMQVGEEMNEQIANYIRGKAIEILIVGVSTYIGFIIMGLNYSALLGLLVGLSVLIPYVGAIIVTIPVVLVGMMQFGTGSEFMTLMLIYGVIQALDGNVLVPLLFSEAVNLHPVVIIIAVIFFGGIWGFWGIFFAIPLATLIKAIMTAWPKVSNPQENLPLEEVE